MRQRRAVRRIGAAEARQNFSQVIGGVRTTKEPVIIEKGGVPVAAVVPLGVLEREERWAEERSDRLALLERLRRSFRDVSTEEIERQAATALADIRSERAGARGRRRR